MIALVTFYAPGCLLALKRLCEWLLEVSAHNKKLKLKKEAGSLEPT